MIGIKKDIFPFINKYKTKIGEWLWILGIGILFATTLIYLKDNLPTVIKYFEISNRFIIKVAIGIILCLLGYWMKYKKGHLKKKIKKYIKRYVSQIINILSTTLIIIVLITNFKYKEEYILGIIIISFILFIFSEEISE